MRPLVQQARCAVPARSPRSSRGRLAVVLGIALLVFAACDGGHKPASTPTDQPAGPATAATAAAGSVSKPSRGPVTPPPKRTPTPTPSANSSETAQKYLDLWQQAQYGPMYDLLTSAAKQSITKDAFTGRYQAIADEATITAVKTSFAPAADKQADKLPFSVTYTTSLFGDLKQDLTMPLAREADGWRVQWTPSLIFSQLGATNLVHNFVDIPQRGSIVARDGTPLAITASVGVVGTSRALMNSPQAVKDKQASINALAQKLNLNAADIQGKIDNAATPADYFISLKTLPYDEPADQRSAIEAIPGAIVQDTPERVYPLGQVTAHVVGYVSKITAEQLATLKAEGYGPDDLVGASGLEATYEAQLAGKRGARLTIITPDGQVVQELAKRDGTPPTEVVTTIDVKAQQGAFTALSTGDHIGSLVMLDPTDNSVLAMVSWPSYDPNWFVQGLTDAQAKQVLDETRKPLLNRATLATYPPGSTFKVVTASAGLEKGGLTPTSTLPCPPVWFGLGQNLPKRNWRPDDLGKITITDALMTSCDPVFYQVGLDLDHIDPNILPSYAAGFGYGRATGINGIQEADGLDPNPDWKQKTLQQSWFSGDSVNMAIGQGYLLVTPLQVANAYSAIARGDLRSPLLVKELRPAVANAAAQTFESKVVGPLPVSAATLGVIREGIRRVVQDPRGTAYDVFKGSQLNAAGKSGTAEDVGLDHVSFVSYAPVTGPKAVTVVVLDSGVSGSLEAGPIARKSLETYLLGH
ncbi:MAG: penicillin-binding transpeptidase domain-containing protein [Dehalococcoidia bacterium]